MHLMPDYNIQDKSYTASQIEITSSQMDEIHLLLRRIGLRGTLCGFAYMATAVSLVLSDETHLNNLTKRLYPEIAKIWGTNSACVSKSLCRMVNIIWLPKNKRKLEEIIGYEIHEKPYAGEMIDILAAYLK